MRTARRIQGIQPSATLAMAARAAELKRQGRPIISLTTGEPDFDTPQHIKDAAVQAIREGFTKYTPAAGIPELRDAVRERIRADLGLEYSREEVIVTCGAKHAIFNALMAICDSGDEVVCFSPYWTSYPDLIRSVGGVPVIVETRAEEGYFPDPAALETALTERTRVLIINSPNNPTGAVYTAEVLQSLAGVLQGRDIMVLTDDIYDRLVYGAGRFFSITAAGEEIQKKTILVGSASKTYAMTGWRIGYAAGPREILRGMEAIQSHTTSNPTSISQKAALAALTGPGGPVKSMRKEFDRRRKEMVVRLREIPGISAREPLGAFYVFPQVKEIYGREFRGKRISGSVALAEALLEGSDVAVVPGEAFGDDGAIRLSYALAFDEMAEGIARIRRFFEETLR